MPAIFNYIVNCYNSRLYGSFETFANGSDSNKAGISKFNPFNTYIKLDLSLDKLELPCVYKYIIANVLYKNTYTATPIQKLFIPLFCQSIDYREIKTSVSALKALFWESSPLFNLEKIKVGDNVYFGSEGIILNENFKPLIMFTLEVERVTVNGQIKYAPIKQIIRVNPIVYSSNDILSKYIKSKLITAAFEINTNYLYDNLRNYNNLFTTNKLDWKFKIIIEDFSSFFCHPVIPDVEFTSEAVNKMLTDNIDDLLCE